MPAVPLPPRPSMEDANVPDEAEDILASMIPVGDETHPTPTAKTETGTDDIRTTVSLQDVADPDRAPSDDAKIMVWVRRGMSIALAFILLLVLFALIGSHSATVRQQASAERLQTSMSQLSTWTGKAKTTIKQADQIRLKDTDDTDSLRRLIDSNGRLMHSDRTGLSENESERLAAKADKATKRTRTLTNKIGRLVKEKPLTDAKNKCHTALDKASKASNDAKPSDDATRTAKATLDKLIAQARKLDKKTTIDTWTDMAAKLDRPAKTSPAHWTRKPRPTRSRTPGRRTGATAAATGRADTNPSTDAHAAIPWFVRRLRLHDRAPRQQWRQCEQWRHRQQRRIVRRELRRMVCATGNP